MEVDWKRIGTEFIVYLLNNNKIAHSYALRTAALPKPSHLGHHTCCTHFPRYELQWPVMM